MKRWPIGMWKKVCVPGRILGLRWRNGSCFQKRFNSEPTCLVQSDRPVHEGVRDECIVTDTMIVIASLLVRRLSQYIGFGVRSAG